MAEKKFSDVVYTYIKTRAKASVPEDVASGYTASEIAEALGAQRTNVCAALNELFRAGKLQKTNGKSVRYLAAPLSSYPDPFENGFIGGDGALKQCVRMAKAAVIYPPRGLNTLLIGETGVGKTMFAERMHAYAIQNGALSEDAPFVSFNCAEYASNPQLLLAQLFGYVRGSFTGAEKDHAGIVAKADGGILFLDEIHRLPPEGQEMLFHLLDRDEFTPLGAAENRSAHVLLIAATTEDPNGALLATFRRRIQMIIEIPQLGAWKLSERMELLERCLFYESERIGRLVRLTRSAAVSFLLYDCPGNIGQMKSDVQLASAKAFLGAMLCAADQLPLTIHYSDVSAAVRQGLLLFEEHVEELSPLLDRYDCVSDNTSVPLPGKRSVSLEATHQLRIDQMIDRCFDSAQETDIPEADKHMQVYYDISYHIRRYLAANTHITATNDALSSALEAFLLDAGQQLKRVFSKGVFLGMYEHLRSADARVPSRRYDFSDIALQNPELSQEYRLSLTFLQRMREHGVLSVPDYEAVILALFLRAENGFFRSDVAVILAQHGESAASSTVAVVRELIDARQVYAYDRALNKSFRVVYNELKNLIDSIRPIKGILLLCDSSTFVVMGQLLSEECHIDVRSFEQVSAPFVVAAARYAETEKNIDDAAARLTDEYAAHALPISEDSRERVIVTLCLTGEGSATAIKNIILTHLGANCDGVSILPMAVAGERNIGERVTCLMKEKNVVAVVGTSNPNIYGVPFIPISELILNSGYSMLHRCLAAEEQKSVSESDYQQLFARLRDEITGVDIDRFSVLCAAFIEKVLHAFTLKSPDDTIHLIMHLACNLSWQLNGEKIPNIPIDPDYLPAHRAEYTLVKEALQPIEESFSCTFSENEVVFLLMIILQA